MIFTLFALAVAVVFFFTSLALLNYGRLVGVRHLAKEGASAMAGLNAVEGAGGLWNGGREDAKLDSYRGVCPGLGHRALHHH